MEFIWHILLTTCLGSTCLQQDVQRFDTREQCFYMLEAYKSIPADGDWDSVEYVCKTINSVSL